MDSREQHGRQQQGQPSSGELVHSMAPSPAELWHEILEQLREVQDNQARLATAIENLSVMFKDAMALDNQPMVGPHPWAAGRERGELPTFRAAPTLPPESRADPGGAPADPVFPLPATLVPDEVKSTAEWAPSREVFAFKGAPDPAETSRDDARDFEAPSGSQTADVSEPVLSQDIPEPLFYVPPLGEDVLTLSSVVDLTPSALDAVLAAEFNDAEPTVVEDAAVAHFEPPAPEQVEPPASALVVEHVTDVAFAPDPDVPHMAGSENGKVSEIKETSLPSAEARLDTNDAHKSKTESSKPKGDPSEVLDILLGTPKAGGSTSSGVVGIPEPAASSVPAFDSSPVAPPSAPPPSAVPPPLELTFETSTAPSVPPPPPVAESTPEAPAFEMSSPPQPPPAPPVFEAAPPPPPPPPVFEAAPPPPPPVFEAAPPPPPPPPPVVESAPREPVFDAARTPPTVADLADAVEDASEGETDDDSTSIGIRVYSSAASMASEILSARPEAPEPEPESESPRSSLISEDLTLIARGRRSKRFRIR